VKFAFIKGHRATLDVGVMCAVFFVTRPGFYAWLSRPESPRAARARELSGRILDVYREVDGVYGSIKSTGELSIRGHHADRKTVAGLMRRMGIRSKVCGKFRVRTTDSDHDGPIAPNTLGQNFAAADALDKVWAADITCLGGECCPACDAADCDGDRDVGTDLDIEAFFRVLGGGVC